MNQRKVDLCGVDTSKLPVLTNKVMRELFVKMQNGDKNAREEIISGNLRLVLSVIHVLQVEEKISTIYSK